MGRFAASLELAKSSWAVLKDDKELAAIPVMSAGVSLVVVAAFGGGAYLSTSRVETAGQSEISVTPITYAVGAVGYLAVSVVVTYFAAVLVSGALQRLGGDDPSLGSAFRQANSRIGSIVAWGLLTGTVGLVLQMLKERAGFIGRIVIGAIGMAWEVVTWLAVPVVVVEGVGPIHALKRSASLFRQTWGENLIAQVGLGLLSLALIAPGVIVAFLLGMAVPMAGMVLGVLWVLVISIVMSALNGIFRAALYLYATGNPAEQYFADETMAAAFGQRTRRI